MTQTINQPKDQEKAIFHQLLQEIELIPSEQQENLLQLIRLSRTCGGNPCISDSFLENVFL